MIYEASPLSYLDAQKAFSKLIDSASTIGAIASKKWRCSLFVNSLIASANLSLVSGPDAIITFPSGISVISSLTSSISGLLLIRSVTAFEKSSLAIASALPAGTAFSYAILISSPPKISISFFRRPLALVISEDPKLLEHTNSAQSEVTCAPVVLLGRISYSLTFIPLLASWRAASEPARPAPIILTSSMYNPLSISSGQPDFYRVLLRNTILCLPTLSNPEGFVHYQGMLKLQG